MAGNQRATNPTDWTNIDETAGATQDWPTQWGSARKILLDMASIWWAIYGTGAVTEEPTRGLQYLAFGDANANKLEVRVGYSGGNVLRFQRNTGSDAAPTWAAAFAYFDITTGDLTITGDLSVASIASLGGLTLSGALNMGGNNITNVGTITSGLINGVNVASHATRHAQSGGDPLTVGVPLDVGAANAAGAASDYVKRDHVHRGVSSLLAGTRIVLSPAGPPSYGQITVSVATRIQTQYTNLGGDQAVGASAVETNVNNLIGKNFPGTPAVNTYYEISGALLVYADLVGNPNSIKCRVYVGPAGSMADGAGSKIGTWANGVSRQNANEEHLIGVPFGPIRHQLANAAYKIGLSYQQNSTVGGAAPGANTLIKGSAGEFCYLYIKEMPF